MPTQQIEWADGSGDKIYITSPDFSGNQQIAVSSDPNTGAARSKVVTFSAGNISKTLTVQQDAGYTKLTLKVNPSSYSGTTLTDAANAYTSETSTTAARVRVTTTQGGTTSDYLIFNTSQLPNNAVILSVSCKVKTYISSTTGISPRSVCMYSGTSQKGTAQSLTTSAKTFTFSGVNWTVEELRNARVRVWATRTSGTTTSFIFFYGATLTIEYYVP